ncbi:MAG: hypothetical protein ACRYE9_04720, partial [Janthinobacterium lividum]
RMRPSFLESNSSICSHCNGKGLVRADQSNSMLILRTVENEICNDNVDIVNVYTNVLSGIYLLNNKRKEIKFIEDKYNIKLNFFLDQTATSDNYSIEKIKSNKRNQSSNNSIKPATQISSSSQSKEPEVTIKNGKSDVKDKNNIIKGSDAEVIESIISVDNAVTIDGDTSVIVSEEEEQSNVIEKAKPKRNNRRRVNKKSFVKKKPTEGASSSNDVPDLSKEV